MIYHTDGYCIDKNPSTEGGYTITTKEGVLVAQGKFTSNNITNNQMELQGIARAVEIAGMHDTILTDSQICLGWVLRGKTKGRKDLDFLCGKVLDQVLEKGVMIAWLSRDWNEAGKYNEENYNA